MSLNVTAVYLTDPIMLPSPALLTEMALESGFDLVGFAPAAPGRDGDRFLAWLDAGRQGSMDYLARNRDRVLSPQTLLPGVGGAVALGFDYTRSRFEVSGGGRVARYAVGRDYHRALAGRLRELRRRLVADGANDADFRLGVDAIPFLERSLAMRAGIGFLAKSSGIIHARRGPWLLLAELLTTSELPQSAPAPGSCGTCTRCLTACPTHAFVGPFELDARRCLSYTTIEHRGLVDRELRFAQGEWLFGCDICIEVCPYTSRATPRDPSPDLAPHEALESYDLVGVLELDAESWDRDWTATAIRRATRTGLRRNAATVLGNLGDEGAAPSLVAALEDPDGVVRASAGWALARLGAARKELAEAIDRETDPAIRDDLAASLDEFRQRR